MANIGNIDTQAGYNSIIQKSEMQAKGISASIFDKFDANKDNLLDANETDAFYKMHYGGNFKRELKENNLKSNEITLFENQLEKTGKNKLMINGKIGGYAQRSENTCWVLGSLDAMSQNEKYAKILKESISVDENENITVKLGGIGKEYTFNADEIRKDQTLAKGDDDVKAFEYAVKLYRKETGRTNPKEGGRLAEMMHLFAGEKVTTINPNITTEGAAKVAGKIKTKNNPFPSAHVLQSELGNLLNESSNSPTTMAFYPDKTGKINSKLYGKYGLIPNHMYVLRELKDDKVTLHNPHGTQDVNIPLNDFMKLKNEILLET